MPRPLCPRRIRHLPPATWFKPAGIPLFRLQTVDLGLDEVEALRLADLEGLYRVEAARQMEVSRQTFDRILKRARKKVSTALIEGRALRILQPPEPAADGAETIPANAPI